MTNWLVTYRPLSSSVPGRKIAAKYGFPEYEDASPRREPSFGETYSFVTALCRPIGATNRLQVGNRLFYLSAMNPERKRYLMAVLDVVETLASHEEAAAWFREHGLPPTSNCVLADDSNVMPEEQSLPLKCWAERYRERAAKNGVFAICATRWLNTEGSRIELPWLVNYQALQNAIKLESFQAMQLHSLATGAF